MIDISLKDQLHEELEVIRSIKFEAYINIKHNVDAVFQKLLAEEAEMAFLENDLREYHVYLVSPGRKDMFARCLGFEWAGRGDAFFLVRKEYEYAAVIFTDECKHICQRINLYNTKSIADIYYTFKPIFCNALDYIPDYTDDIGEENNYDF